MLAKIDPSSWFIISVLVILVAFWIGFIADAVLNDFGWGLIANTVLITVGGFVGFFALDWLILHYYINVRHANAYSWSASGILGGTLTFMAFCLLKRVARR
jgi:hypothetical protein